ncbi:MAG: guanylate kinase [Clostridium sp.]|nr:guanylate kinase [Clostridium sp.]
MNKGMLVVLSAPSGCGKDTVFKEICKKRDDVAESVSATTRAAREGEVDGVNYYFVSREQFQDMIENQQLLEYCQYNNCYYGTPVKSVNRVIKEGKICFLIIEVQGAQRVMDIYPECLSIFLLPPSLDVLEQRLRGRDSDGEDMILSRLEIAKTEMEFKDKYDYQVINDDLDECVDEINKIISDELNKRLA